MSTSPQAEIRVVRFLSLTEDVRRDLWQFFGASAEDASLRAGSWPTLSDDALVYPPRSLPALRLDTPFGLAFRQWRDEVRGPVRGGG